MTNPYQNQSEEDISPLIERLIDANLNRLKEGLRVIEDIYRYIHNDREATSHIKKIRHSLQLAHTIKRLQYRNIEGDIQKKSIDSEQRRDNLNDLVLANFSRAEESSRVLEEVFKLDDIVLSEQFKKIRYQLYILEKKYFQNYL